MWKEYDSGVPNVFVVGDFNVAEHEMRTAIELCMQINGGCPYTPVYTKGVGVDKDFALFFKEGGAEEVHFGNEWQKSRGDNRHFPILVVGRVWFPVTRAGPLEAGAAGPLEAGAIIWEPPPSPRAPSGR